MLLKRGSSTSTTSARSSDLALASESDEMTASKLDLGKSDDGESKSSWHTQSWRLEFARLFLCAGF